MGGPSGRAPNALRRVSAGRLHLQQPAARYRRLQPLGFARGALRNLRAPDRSAASAAGTAIGSAPLTARLQSPGLQGLEHSTQGRTKVNDGFRQGFQNAQMMNDYVG